MPQAAEVLMLDSLFGSAWPVTRFEEIDSTNEEARRRADAGDFGPSWFVADRQMAGRGRLGRPWASPVGNLYATAFFRLEAPLSEAAKACFAAGLAVLDAARACGAPEGWLRLKWPNDVLADEAKVAGILIETGQVGGHTFMAAGFGVNVKTAPEAPGRRTACLAQGAGMGHIDAPTLLTALDIAFRARLRSLFQNGFTEIRTDWLAHSAHLGQVVEVSPGGDRISGAMRGIDADGALVLELADGAHYRVRAGDVSLVA